MRGPSSGTSLEAKLFWIYPQAKPQQSGGPRSGVSHCPTGRLLVLFHVYRMASTLALFWPRARREGARSSSFAQTAWISGWFNSTQNSRHPSSPTRDAGGSLCGYTEESDMRDGRAPSDGCQSNHRTGGV